MRISERRMNAKKHMSLMSSHEGGSNALLDFLLLKWAQHVGVLRQGSRWCHRPVLVEPGGASIDGGVRKKVRPVLRNTTVCCICQTLVTRMR